MLLALCAATVTLSSCSVDSGLDLQAAPEALTEQPQAHPRAGEARLFTTTADGVYKLYQDSVAVFTDQNMAPTTIEIDPTRRYQSMDGFGFAITYATCYNLLKMSQQERTALLRRTFSPTQGYGVSYARISIGCNDFSSTEYTLCDEKGLDHFRLHSDETRYVIPVLKEILAINPDLKIMAAPWTCPRWMKVADIQTKAPHNAWTDGHLNPDLRKDYAQYFVKFVKAMAAEGIRIHAVTPQNEPLNKANTASLYMPWQEEADFVRELAAAFKQSGVQTKIYVYDHNYDYGAGQDDYPVKVYDALGHTFEGSELVVGAAYHDYGGSNTELTDVYQKAPQKELLFTESSIGTWNDGRNLSKRLLADMQNVALGTVNRMCKAVMVWNFMLDDKMGPNLDGGCQTCYGAIDISSADYSRLTYNSHYYIIAHLSAAAAPGAIRLGTRLNVSTPKLIHTEFLNPDGTYGAVLINTGDTQLSVTLSDGKAHFLARVPANGVVSCRWK